MEFEQVQTSCKLAQATTSHVTQTTKLLKPQHPKLTPHYVSIFCYSCAESVAAIHNSVGRKNLDSILNHNPLRSQPQSFAHEKSLPRGLPTLMLSQLFCNALMRLSNSFRFLLRVSRASHLWCRIRNSKEVSFPIYLFA